jgi:hypothetical protein
MAIFRCVRYFPFFILEVICFAAFVAFGACYIMQFLICATKAAKQIPSRIKKGKYLTHLKMAI